MNKLKNQKPRCPKDTNPHQKKYKKQTNKQKPTRNKIYKPKRDGCQSITQKAFSQSM